MKNNSCCSSRLLKRHKGFTIIELMVTLVLMLLITLATVALYTVNSQSSKTVDATASVDDTARFIFEVMGRSIQLAGYKEVVRISDKVDRYSTNSFNGCVNTTEPCPLLGFDNSIITAAANNFGSAGSGTVNSSDSLAIRFAGAGLSSGGAADNTLINCLGTPIGAPIDDSAIRTSLGMMGFYVSFLNGNTSTTPELYCRTPAAGGGSTTQPIARGVETMQLLYGIDIDGDSVPNRWVRATSITDWSQVRAVRIGLVLAGEVGSSQVVSTNVLYPLGKEFSEGLGGDALYTPPADTRYRKVFNATFFLRNEV